MKKFIIINIFAVIYYYLLEYVFLTFTLMSGNIEDDLYYIFALVPFSYILANIFYLKIEEYI